MTRLVLAVALAAGAVAPVAASATESCYYRSSVARVCRDAEYRACVIYGSVATVPFEVGNGCP